MVYGAEVTVCVLDWVFTASTWKPGDGTVPIFLQLSLFSDHTLCALDYSDEGAGSVYSDLACIILLGVAYFRNGQTFWSYAPVSYSISKYNILFSTTWYS